MIVIVLLILFITPQSIVYADNVVTDEPVAIVNGEAITKDEFYTRLLQIGGKGILEQMIGDVLIRQEAVNKGVKATPDEIEEKVNEYKKRFSKVDNR